MKFFNRASNVENTFSYECQFSKQDIKESESKISDVLKCKDGVFNIQGKLIWQSDIRSPSSCSQSVPDAIIVDATGSISVSIWEEHYTKVKENSFYYVKNLKIRNFNGICLTTQRFTEFSESEAFEIVDSSVEEIICCPEIMNGSVNVYHICNNPNCRKKLFVPAGATLVTSRSCQRRLLLQKASVQLNVVVQLEASDWQSVSVTIFPSLLKKLFGEKCIDDAVENPDSILTQLLMLDNHDFTLTRASNPHGI